MTKIQVQQQTKKIAERKKNMLEGLPHLYGRKWYSWAWSFFQSVNKMNLLVAANQISKSSTQIRKCIHWATAQKLWPELWPNKQPEQVLTFWYMYPSYDVMLSEFEKKWIPEFLPRGQMRSDQHYGWNEIREKQILKGIKFNCGTIVEFKTYSQNVSNLQTATIFAIFCDEELPEDYYPELNARLIATSGYFHMVFTATLNQVTWHRAMEGKRDGELFPNAFKLQVSMYDCLTYNDGSPTPWTEERIAEIIAGCSTPSEVQRRVHGKFIKEGGRKFEEFSADRHFIKPFTIPQNYPIYAAVDIGSGADNHPAAIAFVAVTPDHKRGYIFRGWRGDSVVTTSSDVYEKFKEVRGSLRCVLQLYDGHAKDFGTITSRMNESFVRANKSHELGEDTINTLFKNDMLYIFDIPELQPLGTELASLMKSTPKTKAKDDFADAMRYACTSIPWDFTAIKSYEDIDKRPELEPKPLTEAEYLALEIDERRGIVKKSNNDSWNELEEEFAEWNDIYGSN